jgi:hypothetical protein
MTIGQFVSLLVLAIVVGIVIATAIAFERNG